MIQALAEPLEKTFEVKTLRNLSTEQRREIEKLIERGSMTQTEIGHQVGCTHNVVSDVKLDNSARSGETSLTNPIILNRIEKRIIKTCESALKRIDSVDVDKSHDFRAYAAAFCDLFKVARLISGESTANIATKNLSTLIVQIDDEARGKGIKTSKGKDDKKTEGNVQ